MADQGDSTQSSQLSKTSGIDIEHAFEISREQATSAQQYNATDPVFNQMWSGDGHVTEEDDSDSEQVLLDPEHPLMVRFQTALGTHLKKRVAELDTEQKELNAKLAETAREREELGMILYSEQQDLALVQAKLESINENLQTHTATRLTREAEMDCLRKFYKTVVREVDASRSQASVMQKELDNINIRLFCLMNSQSDVRSDVKVMKRAALKTKQDLTEQEQKKQMQDYQVDLLAELIDRKQEEIGMSEAQTMSQAAETLKFKKLLSEADMELEVLRADMKQIHSNWRATLLGMKRRDEALSHKTNSLREAEKLLLSKQREVDAFQRSISDSEERHERLSYTLTRVNNDLSVSRKALVKTRKRFDELKIEFSQKARILQSIETSCFQINAEKTAKECERAIIQKEFEQVMREKSTIKEQLVDVLQEHTACNKAAGYARKKAMAVIEHIGKIEAQISSDENELARLEQELIAYDVKLSANKELIAAVQTEVRSKNELCTSYEVSFNRNHITIERKQNFMDESNRRLAALLEQREGNEVSPLENVTLNLAKTLRKQSHNMLDAQTMWVEKQQEFMNLITEKHELAVSIKRQNQAILVLNGRKSKLDRSIEKVKKEKHCYDIDMRQLRVEMEKLASKVYDQKERKEQMEASSCFVETDFMRELKELELSMFSMKDTVASIQAEKESLLNQLVHLESQVSWWQRKIQLGTEIKETIDPKRNSNADLTPMKCEIHRMTMRYESLMKEQERLIRSMEDSVTRREYVVSGYNARVRRDPQVLTKSKCHRQINETKGNILKFKKEMERLDGERKQLQIQMSGVASHLDGKKHSIAACKDEISSVELTIKQSSNIKHKNLIELLRRQKRMGHNGDIQKGKYKPLYSSQSRLAAELSGEQRVMEQLGSIVEKLKAEFSSAAFSLDRVTACYGFIFDNVQSDN
ncbi:coiled-coil domain-containing protein 40-like [Watersipora subatra]|uniref:coiled-coil domain-containing protein 40-like n=1 Tax=Watersipora subatra TaxID=2589382 RepID=UPI00355B87A2